MKRKYIFLSIILLSIIGLYFYIYHDKRNIATETSAFSIKLIDLETNLKTDEITFNKNSLQIFSEGGKKNVG